MNYLLARESTHFKSIRPDIHILYYNQLRFGELHRKKQLGVKMLARRRSSVRVMSEDSALWRAKKMECLENKTLFEDPDFPADMSSCFRSKTPKSDFIWKRPKEIIGDPQMFADGASRFDITQGKLGDCWLLASLACLSMHEDMFHVVVPKDQDFDDPDYCGCFRFYFWVDGNWQEILIDDRLPTYRDNLVFVHSRDKNEFWSALVEKAYAKLFGCYEALMGGSIEEGLADFTGGITEQVDLKTDGTVDELYTIVRKAFNRRSLMGCSIPVETRQDMEAKLDNGLIVGHAYSITGLVELERRRPGNRGNEVVKLIRVRNPWGAKEWNGAWSDESPEWRSISEKEKQQLDLVSDEDGEFWMDFEDFSREFKNVAICHREPDEEEAEGRRASVKKQWFVDRHDNQWNQSTAGGCRNFKESFTKNPQFRVELVDVDEGDDDDLCTMVISLMQKKTRGRRSFQETFFGPQFSSANLSRFLPKFYRAQREMNRKLLFQVDQNAPDELDLNYILHHKQVAKSKTFTDAREVVLRTRLPPGEYCIIPSTHEPNKYGNFLLRIYTEKQATSVEIDDETSGTINFETHVFTNKEASTADTMSRMFQKLAGDDQECDVRELKQILDKCGLFSKLGQTEYGEETCRNLVSLFDIDYSGSLDISEFREMWRFICKIHQTFVDFDADNSGALSAFELRPAIKSLGASLSKKIIAKLVRRYSNKEGDISINDFISVASKVASCLAACEEFNFDDSSTAEISLSQLINFALYV
ncbi:calpain-9-like [Convolutriloba macropyga]|uniref:calpain-9-like n=1 Tax=Convolutriloba macropyga TaxID=536237 RepID=UPI003F51B7FB